MERSFSESSDGVAKRTILVFTMDEQRYGVDASVVQELLPVCSVTPLPKAPPIVEGAINVRGQVVPVFNVRQRFGLRPAVVSPTEHTMADAVAIMTGAVQPEDVGAGVAPPA